MLLNRNLVLCKAYVKPSSTFSRSSTHEEAMLNKVDVRKLEQVKKLLAYQLTQCRQFSSDTYAAKGKL
jgi:hypothetical protein